MTSHSPPRYNLSPASSISLAPSDATSASFPSPEASPKRESALRSASPPSAPPLTVTAPSFVRPTGSTAPGPSKIEAVSFQGSVLPSPTASDVPSEIDEEKVPPSVSTALQLQPQNTATITPLAGYSPIPTSPFLSGPPSSSFAHNSTSTFSASATHGCFNELLDVPNRRPFLIEVVYEMIRPEQFSKPAFRFFMRRDMHKWKAVLVPAPSATPTTGSPLPHKNLALPGPLHRVHSGGSGSIPIDDSEEEEEATEGDNEDDFPQNIDEIIENEEQKREEEHEQQRNRNEVASGHIILRSPKLDGREGCVAVCAALLRLQWMQAYFQLRPVSFIVRVSADDLSLRQLAQFLCTYLMFEVGAIWSAMLYQSDRVRCSRHGSQLSRMTLHQACHAIHRITQLDDFSGHGHRSFMRMFNSDKIGPFDSPYIMDLSKLPRTENPDYSNWISFHMFPARMDYVEVQPWLTFVLTFVHRSALGPYTLVPSLLTQLPSNSIRDLIPSHAFLALFKGILNHPMLYQHWINRIHPDVQSMLPYDELIPYEPSWSSASQLPSSTSFLKESNPPTNTNVEYRTLATVPLDPLVVKPKRKIRIPKPVKPYRYEGTLERSHLTRPLLSMIVSQKSNLLTTEPPKTTTKALFAARNRRLQLSLKSRPAYSTFENPNEDDLNVTEVVAGPSKKHLQRPKSSTVARGASHPRTVSPNMYRRPQTADPITMWYHQQRKAQEKQKLPAPKTAGVPTTGPDLANRAFSAKTLMLT